MTSNLRICLAQINTTVGDYTANQNKIINAITHAKKGGASLVVFPEMTLNGYPPEDLLLKKEFVATGARALQSLLPHTKGVNVILGFAETQGKQLYNTAAFISNGKVAAKYHKINLPNYGVFDEQRYFTPGQKNLIVDAKGVRFGISICEDIWREDSLFYSKDYKGSVSVLINISASPFHRGKQSEREALLKNLALKVQAPVIYQNLVGGQDELVFDGGSMVTSQAGKLLSCAKRFQEDLIFLDLPVKVFSSAIKKSKNIQVVRCGALPVPETHHSLNNIHMNRRFSNEEDVYKALVLGTLDYVRKNGFKKVLIGLSGGIDSALVACIAADALGSKNVIGVTMPSKYTSKGTYRDAKNLAKNLRIECLEFGIQKIFALYLSILKKAISGDSPGATEENLQARIRGNILMALSNQFGYLVLTTGNKSEMATGYCTLYGDMAGGFAVIKDVPKTLVYRLSAYRNGVLPKNIIPGSVIKRAPTAELRFHQKDQDSLPPYTELDRFLELYVERDLSVAEAVAKGVAQKVARQGAHLVDRNEYKRRQSPPGIKITPKAFGRDRRMPITNRYPL